MCPSSTCSTARATPGTCKPSVPAEAIGTPIEALNAALIRYMEVIGEAARRVPQGLRACYSAIDWPRIVGLRNRLIHEYDRVNLRLLRLIIQNELPPLIAQLERILEDRDTG